MYSLLGLIQLLMLTQSRLMPDLDVLFKPAPPPTEAASYLPIQTTRAVETGTVYRQALATIRRKRYAEKWIPPVCRNNIAYKRSLKGSFSRRRVITADKLYLVFCQWKTEG